MICIITKAIIGMCVLIVINFAIDGSIVIVEVHPNVTIL